MPALPRLQVQRFTEPLIRDAPLDTNNTRGVIHVGSKAPQVEQLCHPGKALQRLVLLVVPPSAHGYSPAPGST